MNMYDPASEASEGPHLGVVMPPSEQSATAEFKFVKFSGTNFYRASYGTYDFGEVI
jgi:hypothetical protein